MTFPGLSSSLFRLAAAPVACKRPAVAQAAGLRFCSNDQFTPSPFAGIPLEKVDLLIEGLNRQMREATTQEAKTQLGYEAIGTLVGGIRAYLPSTADLRAMSGELTHQLDNISGVFVANHVMPMEDSGQIPPDFDQLFQERLLSCRERIRIFNDVVASAQTPVQVWKMVKDALTPMAVDKGVQLQCSGLMGLTGACDGFEKCSSKKFYMLLMNLVQNAIKYTPSAGTVNIDFSTEYLPQTQKLALCTRVTDEGIGIPPGELEQVLQGHRASNALASGIHGTGFGLGQVQTLVSDTGARLTIESPLHPEKDNPGTRFSCWLPLKEIF